MAFRHSTSGGRDAGGAMRDFAMIAPQFWTGDTGRTLRKAGPDGMLVAMYLLTSPHSNVFGLYYMPIMYVAHDLNLPVERAQAAMHQCIDAKFCTYDEEAEVVWVFNMAKFQIGETVKPTDNRAKWIASEWQRLPKCSLLSAFIEKYGHAFGMTEAPCKGGSEAPSKPLQSPSQGATEAPTPDKDKEKDKNKNIYLTAGADARVADTVPNDTGDQPQDDDTPDITFVQFMDAYPDTHRDDDAAWVAWKTQRKKRALPGLCDLFAALEMWGKSEQWNTDNGAFIPLASNFIGKGYWKRTPPPPKQRAQGGRDSPVQESQADRAARLTFEAGQRILARREGTTEGAQQ